MDFIAPALLGSKDLFIVGTTASGKSSFSIDLATRLNRPIVNCDSLQFYSDLKIGTAYPEKEDFIKVKHLLFGVAQAGTEFTAGEFVRHFTSLKNNELKNKECLIVGGSGFYIKALETGMEDIEHMSLKMKEEVSFLNYFSDQEKAEHLKEIDPDIFKIIHPNDIYRVGRALEVYYSQGIKMSDLNKNEKTNYKKQPKLGLFFERSELFKRVQNRTELMIQKGLVDEVKGLIAKGLKDWKPLASVGYKEVLMHLNNKITLDEMKDLIIKNTMILAKRQMTWFRADTSVIWFHGEKEYDKALSWAMDFDQAVL